MYETNVTSEPIEPSKTRDKGAQTDNNNGKGVLDTGSSLKMSMAEKPTIVIRDRFQCYGTVVESTLGSTSCEFLFSHLLSSRTAFDMDLGAKPKAS